MKSKLKILSFMMTGIAVVPVAQADSTVNYGNEVSPTVAKALDRVIAKELDGDIKQMKLNVLDLRASTDNASGKIREIETKYNTVSKELRSKTLHAKEIIEDGVNINNKYTPIGASVKNASYSDVSDTSLDASTLQGISSSSLSPLHHLHSISDIRDLGSLSSGLKGVLIENPTADQVNGKLASLFVNYSWISNYFYKNKSTRIQGMNDCQLVYGRPRTSHEVSSTKMYYLSKANELYISCKYLTTIRSGSAQSNNGVQIRYNVPYISNNIVSKAIVY